MLSPLRHLIAPALALSTSVAFAVPISWTDWTTSASQRVEGTLSVDAGTVGVTYIGPYAFARAAGNFWTEPGPVKPYTGSALVDNAPPAPDIVGLAAGGMKTITFSRAVQDPLIALVSWNGNTVDFGVPIDIISFGQGYWGSGTPILNAAGTGFFGSGEVHGVIRLPGSYSLIAFTDTSEGWHGFTVGLVSSVPEPTSLAMLAIGLVGLGVMRRRKMT